MSVLITLIVLSIYFLPSIMAAISKKSNTLAIFLLNLLLGWTLIGWVIALVWSATNDKNNHEFKPSDNRKIDGGATT